MAKPSQKQIAKAVENLVNAQTWEESKRIVEIQSDVLLTDTADQFLVHLLEQYKGDENITQLLEEHRLLLAYCRRDGIEVAFAHYQRTIELQALIDEIMYLDSPSELTRRVELCHAALQLVNGKTQPELWAILHGFIANSLFQNPKGERAENLEQAIYHFKQTLTVYTYQAFPERWANVQHDLAMAHLDRVRGERAENLEQAIRHFEQALQVYTRQAFPQDWADVQHNLALAYRERIRGERAENLEQAIHLFEQALQVYTRQAFPEHWGSTQHNLALTYRERIRGERAENLEQAIHLFEQALIVFTPKAFPERWAFTQYNLALAYLDRVRGERAENLEQAIHLFEQALQVYTRQAFPKEWAGIQYNLALAYRERIRGGRAENLEQAIHLFEQSFQIYTRQAFPEYWARTQHDLGNTYGKRIRGGRAENLEQAIHHLEKALQVYTRQAFPEHWARTQHDLGDTYRERIRGERAENLEQAIHLLEQVLEAHIRQAFPLDWANIQNTLASAYFDRIRGERAENLEQAIHLFEQALQVYTRQDFPKRWTNVQNNLATVYLNRIRGERAENLEQAIHLFEQVLQVYTRQAFPQNWADVQHNLALAYRERIRGERAENLEQAILHFEQALQINTRQDFPQDWADVQYNLAKAYRERIRGKRAENLEQAIHLFEQALQVYTRQDFPQNWADVQHNLASTYRERLWGERTDNLERAISHFEQALLVRTPMTFPQDCRNTAYSLGLLLYDSRHFSAARLSLVTAHQAVEALRGELKRDVAKRTVSEENASLYAHLVSCCLREGDEVAAFLYATAGKGRAFVDLLSTAHLDLSDASSNDLALADDLRNARELRQQIDALLAILTNESGPSTSGLSSTTSIEPPSRTTLPPDVLRAQLHSLQAQEIRLWDELAYKYPALTATQTAPMLSVEQASTMAAELNATLVEYYQHAEGWCAFVVTPKAMHHVPLPLIDNDLLERMVTWMLRLEYSVGRSRLSEIRLSEWYDAVIAPLEAYLPQKQPVVLAPFGALHVLPLVAARHPQTGRYVAEGYQIAFAPSLSALRTVSDQMHRTGRDGQVVPHRLLSVAYPGAPSSDHYLPNVLPEAEAIANHFAQVTPLYHEEATPQAVLAHSHDQDVIHFGCHGWFDPQQPEQSGLMLAGGWLTVQRIITELRLEQAQVATLGACLSGRVRLQGGDENVGLLQAMLTSGAKAVVASLWSADDASTRVLFEAFYAELVAGRSPAQAMQEAARRVRERPGWEHPYYWAAFQVSGLAHTRKEPA